MLKYLSHKLTLIAVLFSALAGAVQAPVIASAAMRIHPSTRVEQARELPPSQMDILLLEANVSESDEDLDDEVAGDLSFVQRPAFRSVAPQSGKHAKSQNPLKDAHLHTPDRPPKAFLV